MIKRGPKGDTFSEKVPYPLGNTEPGAAGDAYQDPLSKRDTLEEEEINRMQWGQTNTMENPRQTQPQTKCHQT